MTPATANLIVRNAGGPYASDAALIREARATDYFTESDAELLTILHAAQRQLQGASRGGSAVARKRRQRREDRAAAVESFAAQLREAATAAKKRLGTPEWARCIDYRVKLAIAYARKTHDYMPLLRLEHDLESLKK